MKTPNKATLTLGGPTIAARSNSAPALGGDTTMSNFANASGDGTTMLHYAPAPGVNLTTPTSMKHGPDQPGAPGTTVVQPTGGGGSSGNDTYCTPTPVRQATIRMKGGGNADLLREIRAVLKRIPHLTMAWLKVKAHLKRPPESVHKILNKEMDSLAKPGNQNNMWQAQPFAQSFGRAPVELLVN